MPSRPPGAQHAPQLARCPLRDRRRCARRSRRSPSRTTRRRTAAPARRPAPTRSRRLAPRALEHLLGEVEPDDVGAAGARAPIARSPVPQQASSDAVAAAHGLLDRDPPPAPVEPGGHHVVHRVVDRRDPVEHPLHALGRTASHGLPPARRAYAGHCPHRFVSVFSSPSWSSARPTTKSTRSSTVSAPW